MKCPECKQPMTKAGTLHICNNMDCPTNNLHLENKPKKKKKRDKKPKKKE